ncbi:hypothetical protein O7614_18175 [Micromonospora sp. WMMD961]|uniref:hypothetical protein n=1 Tax=Micromonospora sp. WMMD961 TaxID=3016100 RepID=UPI002416F36A|nr:hypothetical protein [Micromonospora sp. WMMD961]MDG4781584.1 hypothetical protein [Micromonospora sp. WMMD961]
MLDSFLQGLAAKLVEEILKRLAEWLTPKALRSVPHRASPNCPRGGYGVRRWMRGGMWLFLPSVLAFAWGFGFTLLGVPVVVLTVVAVVVPNGVGGLLSALLAVLGLLVPVTLMIVGAFGLAHYHSYPPKWCARCHGRWPRRGRDEYLRASAPVVTCGCGQRLRVPRTAAGARLRCPRCRSEHAASAPAG